MARLDRVAERDGWRCVYCRHEGPRDHFTTDHVIPVARGGDSQMLNMVVACWWCNQSKGQLLPAEWLPGVTFDHPALVAAAAARVPKLPHHELKAAVDAAFRHSSNPGRRARPVKRPAERPATAVAARLHHRPFTSLWFCSVCESIVDDRHPREHPWRPIPACDF